MPLGAQSELEFKEADLKRHLQNEYLDKPKEGDKTSSKKSADKTINQSMVLKDMQLKSAIDVLKVLSAVSDAKKK